jgi:hypothetical protein
MKIRENYFGDYPLFSQGRENFNGFENRLNFEISA